MPDATAGSDYEEALRSATRWDVQVTDPAGQPVVLNSCESADWILVLEPRLWPLAGYDLDAVRRWPDEYRGVTHAMPIGAGGDDSHEVVECDARGDVVRVRRLYDRVNWPHVGNSAAAYSLIPAPALEGAAFRSLRELRSVLAGRGVLSRDLPVSSEVLDVADEPAFLALHEHVLGRLAASAKIDGWSPVAAQVWAEGPCTIHPTVRLVPPVLIRSGVTLDKGAVVVGPTLIGRDARIGRGATVVQAVVGAGATVEPDATVRQRVASGRCIANLADDAAGASPASAMILDSLASSMHDATSEGSLHARRRRAHLLAKRGLDVVIAGLALVALLPLLLIVAVLVKLDSRGPVLFVHRRERKEGREFPCLKFRTMVADAHDRQRELYRYNQLDGPQFKLREDPRVTRLGRWLRATNIDELPQLVNVLLGHMSLVGPRPSPFRENQVCVPWRRARLCVPPGITGLWQLCRGSDRSQGDFHEWIFYDIAYVRHFSIWLDIRILFWTLVTMGGRWSIPMAWVVPEQGRNSVGLARNPGA